jgi:hypothetical protein
MVAQEAATRPTHVATGCCVVRPVRADACHQYPLTRPWPTQTPVPVHLCCCQPA